MKLVFASDIHGSAYYCEKLLQAYAREGADKLFLLGDLLYHGPRNALPRDYAPARVAEMLNANRAHILCVRGNCDSEVDQMVLDFPILADYAVAYLGGRMAYLTHGHVHNSQNLPPMQPGDLLDGRVRVRGVRVAHGLHRDRRAAADGDGADMDLFCLRSVHKHSYLSPRWPKP